MSHSSRDVSDNQRLSPGGDELIDRHNEHDVRWMRRALALAQQAQAQGEVPIGAVLVEGEQELGAGYNCPIQSTDPTAHAEIVALRRASEWCGNYRLPDTTLYVTLEPCIMCAGAIVQARVDRVVFGATEPRSGAAGSVFDVFAETRLNHRPESSGGVLADESAQLLKQFFDRRRAR